MPSNTNQIPRNDRRTIFITLGWEQGEDFISALGLNVKDLANLKERVNERGRSASAQEHERSEGQDHDDDREQPPLLVVLQEVPKLGNEALAAFLSELGDIVVSIFHVKLLKSKLPEIVAIVWGWGHIHPIASLVGFPRSCQRVATHQPEEERQWCQDTKEQKRQNDVRHDPSDGKCDEAEGREQRSIRRGPNERKEAGEPTCEPKRVHHRLFRLAEIEPEQPTFPLNDTAEDTESNNGNHAELPQLFRRRLQVQLSEHGV